jgi:hypothetical protein
VDWDRRADVSVTEGRDFNDTFSQSRGWEQD